MLAPHVIADDRVLEIKTDQTSTLKKKSFWSASAAPTGYHLQAEKGHGLHGVGGKVSIGYGSVKDTYFSFLSADLLLGPYGLEKKGLLVDYLGTGVSYNVGTPIKTLKPRELDGSYGVLLGVSYADINGRSIGHFKHREDNKLYDANESYALKYVEIAFQSGFYYARFKEARPEINEPDSLRTRVEGWLISLVGSFPLYSPYTASYLPISNSAVSDEKIESGEMQGYAIVLSLHSLLGG